MIASIRDAKKIQRHWLTKMTLQELFEEMAGGTLTMTEHQQRRRIRSACPQQIFGSTEAGTWSIGMLSGSTRNLIKKQCESSLFPARFAYSTGKSLANSVREAIARSGGLHSRTQHSFPPLVELTLFLLKCRVPSSEGREMNPLDWKDKRAIRLGLILTVKPLVEPITQGLQRERRQICIDSRYWQ